MRVLQALLIVLALMLVAYLGATFSGGRALFGVVLPYLAFAIFIVFFIAKVLGWAKSPVPFRIPTTCGQANSLPWIKQNKLDCPSTTMGVIGRMLLEVFLFRSLFRNTRAEVHEGPKLAYGTSKFLWLFGILLQTLPGKRRFLFSSMRLKGEPLMVLQFISIKQACPQ